MLFITSLDCLSPTWAETSVLSLSRSVNPRSIVFCGKSVTRFGHAARPGT